ncbi:MAG: TonB-dependent receptor [Cyanobacteria bacterium]|nr:TonB-dependent receptor [Cyanobacteria bacterium GSL.Bin21]
MNLFQTPAGMICLVTMTYALAFFELPAKALADADATEENQNDTNESLAQRRTVVTGVQLETRKRGSTLVLETPTASSPQTFRITYGNTLIIDLINTQLRLPRGERFQQNQPSAGITSLEVVQQYSNTVRVKLVGETEVPRVNFNSTPQGFALEINSDSTLAKPVTPTENNLEQPQQPIELVVTATRTEEEATTVPRSVTVIDQKEIEQQATLTRDVGDILGKVVPGFGPPNQRTTILGQSLRGRDFSVLIDGVPQSTNREFLGDLRTIDPSAIERIEVVRGPTAVYGADAPGGVINIITRQPEEGEFTARSKVGTTLSFDDFDDSFGFVTEQFFSGNVGDVDYRLNFSFESTGAFFDAEGDRIAQEFFGNNLDESDTINVLGKLGWDLTPEQRLQLTINHFDTEQNTNFRAEATPEGEKAEAVEVGDFDIEDSAGSDNTVISLDYNHDDFLGSEVQAQLFYRNYTSRSFPTEQGSFFNNVIGRSRLESERWGGRLEIETPLTTNDNLDLFWGVDYSEESSEQPFDIFDRTAFENSGGTDFEFEREGVFVPPFDLSNFGAFAQLNWEANDRLAVRGGLRYEDINLNVDDFTTFFGTSAEGGEQNIDDVVFNLGTTFDVTDNINLYANFAQGFTVPDFGRILRFPEFNNIISVDESIEVTEPQKVDSYELGIRGNWEQVQTSLAVFYTYSELGISLVSNEELDALVIARSPKRTYGVEGTVDWQPSDQWQLGGTLTLMEGEDNQDGDDNFEALGSRDIQPLKLTAYIQNQTTPNWSNRLQFLIVGDRAVDNSSITEEIDSYVTVDWISAIDMGSGTLAIGVENLFDNLYFPITAQRAGEDDAAFTPARGRTFSINYQVNW